MHALRVMTLNKGLSDKWMKWKFKIGDNKLCVKPKRYKRQMEPFRNGL